MANVLEGRMKLCLLIVIVAADHISGAILNDEFSFTSPMYEASVQEKTATRTASVESATKMGMWRTPSTEGVRYSIVGESDTFEVEERLEGNFIFIDLRTRSLSEDQDVRIRALSRNNLNETFCTVHISVIDINDFNPLFPSEPYHVTIDEDTPIGATIIYVQATDPDKDPENSRFYYSFPDFANNFAIHPTTGRVILTRPVSYDTQSDHELRIHATDRKAAIAGTARPQETTLTVIVRTVNKHAPRVVVHEQLPPYDSSRARVDDRLRHGSKVYAILQVTDPDSAEHGQISVPRIIHSDVGGLFEIQPGNNKTEFLLVFSDDPPTMNGVVNVTLEVSDRGSPVKTTSVTVHVKLYDRNSLVPHFTKSLRPLIVSEVSPAETQVGFVEAKIADSRLVPIIHYSIVSGNSGRTFAIDALSGLITTRKRLSRNSRGEYVLTVAAVNVKLVGGGGRNTTEVHINVQDANDHDPSFTGSEYEARLQETVPVGSLVLPVRADDEDYGNNGSVVYSIVGQADLPFAIDPFNGTITTRLALDADIMKTSRYEFRVRASDRGTPFSRKSESRVTVHVVNTNDNPPIFRDVDCSVNLPRDTMPGTKILQLSAVDIDRNPVTCRLVPGGRAPFNVSSQHCGVALTKSLTSVPLGTKFSLQVVSSDGQLTSEPVKINVTVTSSQRISKICGESPALRAYEQNLNEMLLNPSVPKTSRINFNRTSQLPNKYKPVILSPASLKDVVVSENAPLDSVVFRIRATDKDSGFNGKLWYTITGGNIDSCFYIDTQSGVVRLVRALDREKRSAYNLTVVVADLGSAAKSSSVRVNVAVSDVNDNAPVFDKDVYTFDIPEDVQIGYKIKRNVWANDRDHGQNALVRYTLSPSIGGNKFFIHPRTGFINVTGHLDRETTSEFRLQVTATDSSTSNPLSSTATVIIRVTDVNDNAPRFFRSVYRIRVAEDLPTVAVLFWLEAHDPDAGRNGQLTYSLTNGYTNRHSSVPRFRVDSHTGAIRLAAKLDYRTQSRYNITARVRDIRQSSFSICYLEVEVLPVNRNLNAPYFDDGLIRMHVTENAAIGTRIGSLSAIDEDLTDPERDVGYHISEGTGLGVFSIDQNTGDITTAQGLDRETQRYYWLTVVARDRAPVPLSGHVFVLVEVDDINDNAPLPTQAAYFASVRENSPPGTNVVRVQANDADSEAEGSLTYSFANSNTYNLFRIDPFKGTVRTRRRLRNDKTDFSQLSFDVKVSDSGSPPQFSLVKVIVNLTDINNNDPSFLSELEKSVVLPERAKSENEVNITRVVALDADTGSNAIVQYRWKDPENAELFSIHPRTGMISSSAAFNAGATHTLKVVADDGGKPPRHSRIHRVELSWVSAPETSILAPRFTNQISETQHYYESVDYHLKDLPGKERLITLLEAVDEDSDQLWFSITEGNDDLMFHVNSQNGALLVVGEPDAEQQNFYNLTLKVTDGFNSAYTHVAVAIEDLNDHRPTFQQSTYHFSIAEDTPPNTRITTLQAVDQDVSLRNRNLLYRILASDSSAVLAKFRITSEGVILTNAPLDRETQHTYILTIEVNDQGVPVEMQGYCRVIVTLDDVNEHPPHFTSPLYTAKVTSGMVDAQIGVDGTVGAVVARVHATDRDEGENARVIYSISSGNDNGLWKMNPSSGEISATRRLVNENGDVIKRSTLTVQAADCAWAPLSDSAQVIINISPPQDAPPLFEMNPYTKKMAENTPLGSFIVMLTASATTGVTYEITAGNIGNKFVVNSHSGVVSLASCLDREEITFYNLTVTAITAEGQSANASLLVTLMDYNDNKPIFERLEIVGKVTDGSTPVIDTSTDMPLVVRATDADSGYNSRLVYSILDPTDDVRSRFAVDASTGAVRTIPTDKPLTDDVFTFQVKVVDSGSPSLAANRNARVTIRVISAVESPPVFTMSHYNLEVMLPTCSGVVVTDAIRATSSPRPGEAQPTMTYSISGGNDGRAFAIDSKTGVVSIDRSSVVEMGQTYSLRLRAWDGRRSAAAVAMVTVSDLAANDKLVHFSKNRYNTTVRENSTEILPLVVVHVLDTNLETNIRFSILNSNPAFTIGSTSGVVSTTGSPIDRETHETFELLVEAVDEANLDNNLIKRGRCVVHITVDDVNDNRPQFVDLPYYASVQVDSRIGKPVREILAVDQDHGVNGVIDYRLEGRHSDLFQVDSSSGIVSVKHPLSDTFGGRNAKFNLTVVATDAGSPPLSGRSVLRISVVDRATPVFSSPFYGDVFVSEDAQPHTVVTSSVSAANPDASDVYYTIGDGDPLQQFDIDFHRGTITTLGKLDYERQHIYRLRVRARDARSRAHADVEVEIRVTDVNDNSPIFAQDTYQANLPETAVVGSQILQLEATDKDSAGNGRVTYAIIDNAEHQGRYFLIDRDTGTIWTARTLDRETFAEMRFTVRASDSGVPARYSDVSVIVTVNDINDNAPVFDKEVSEMSVSLPGKVGQFVGRVGAWDADASNLLSYSVRKQSSSSLLHMEPTTGILTLAQPAANTPEKEINAEVSVSDGVSTAVTSLLVHVITSDTHPFKVRFDQLEYNFTLAENDAQETKVGKVMAHAETTVTYAIATDDDAAQLFRIDASSGSIYTESVIDRESMPMSGESILKFEVEAIDERGWISRCPVQVSVTDVNDNSPIFTQDRYATVLVARRANIGHHVMQVVARDADAGENGRVTYAWDEDLSNAKRFFFLHADTGNVEIRERIRLNANVQVLSFYVRATDHGEQSKSSVVSVSIYLANDQDIVPAFARQKWTASVSEADDVGSEVITVKAQAPDVGVTYALASPYLVTEEKAALPAGLAASGAVQEADGPFSPFSIDPQTGVLSLQRQLDRETHPMHSLTVLAYVTTTPELVTSSQIDITVTDANDNSPDFSTAEYRASIVENLPVGTEVLQVSATDPDQGAFGQITYKLLRDDDQVPALFAVNAESGVISTMASLDREQQASHVITVVALDGGKEPRSAECHVTINVIDINDNAPAFLKSNYALSVSEDVEVGFVTPMRVHARDEDSVVPTSLQMYIIEGDRDHQFEVVWKRLQNDDGGFAIKAGLKVIKPLDREVTSSYELTLLLTDGLHTNKTLVTVGVDDVNDNSPQCEQLTYRVSLREDASVNAFVLQARSTDADVGEHAALHYALSGDGADQFAMDSRTGRLSTAALLDRELVSEYFLTATATDSGGRFCSSQIHVTLDDVNDNIPTFENSSLRSATRENTAVNSLLHRIIAYDSDEGRNGTLRFMLRDSVNGQFYIEPKSGVLILQKSLDRETVASYQLEVVAIDDGVERRMSSTATLHLQVLDVNDNPPKFDRSQYEATVAEDAPNGHVIAQVSATSLDSGANAKLRYSITSGNEHGKFAINEETGEVTLIASVDFESVQSYVITVSASDRSEMPLSSSCTLNVIIDDVNDNSPEFTVTGPQITIPEDAEEGRVIFRFSATDRDSGNAGNATYNLSISASAQLPFAIDPITGALTVAPPGVDYERRKAYTLRVVATDGGTPKRSTETDAYVTIEDVNDNRPRFMLAAPLDSNMDLAQCSQDGANCTVHVHESSSDSVVYGVANLNATDADGSENGGPFKFRLVQGNDRGLFYIDADNNLKSKRPLRLDSTASRTTNQLVHRLTVEAHDSGQPFSLAAQPALTLNVVVLKESQYKPQLSPHRVQITISEDAFDGGWIADRLHATDRDVFDADRLKFSLDSPDDFERFVVHPTTGAIKAETSLWPGSHSISVRVSDGSMSSVSSIPVEVTRVTQEALDNSVSITFRRIPSGEAYLTRYHDLFVEQLRDALPHGFRGNRDLLIISLHSSRREVELLFSVRKPPSSNKQSSFYQSKSLRVHLEQRRGFIEDKLRVEVDSIESVECRSLSCDFACLQTPELEVWHDDNRPDPVSASSLSLTTPKFHRKQVCLCPAGRSGPRCESDVCSDNENLCPRGTTCTLDKDETKGYRCASASAPAILSFTGESFAQYKLNSAARQAPFHVNFRLRTFQSNATVFHATGPVDFARLETVGGFLRYTFSCGGAPQTMERDVVRVNDGKWHDIDIQPLQDGSKGSCAFRLTLDNKFVVSVRASSGHNRLNLAGVTLGGMPTTERRSKRHDDADRRAREARSVRAVDSGFRGCLENVEINESPLPSSGDSRAVPSDLRQQNSVQVMDVCIDGLINPEACANSPCRNGGTCVPGADGIYQCKCPPDWYGDLCETSDPCGNFPCQNKGVCLFEGSTVRCRCRDGYSGSRCEEPALCLALHCRNGGSCLVTDRTPVCACPTGWSGQHCEIAVCADGKSGSDCSTETYAAGPTNPGPHAGGPPVVFVIIGIVAVLVLIIAMVVFLLYRRRRDRRKNRPGSGSSNAFLSTDRFNPAQCPHPPVPQLPREYQPSSRNSHLDPLGNHDEQDQRFHQPLVGMVRPCQVSRASPSASDNDSIQKPPPSWEEYDAGKYNDSASSSGMRCAPDHKASALSINDQSYDWDVTDWKPDGSGMVPQSVASVAYGRRAHSDIPSSPDSRRSISSAATGRSRRSHRSDALSGHYCNSEKRRREKQILQLATRPDLPKEDQSRLQQMISSYLNDQVPNDSRNSSIRSSASRYRPSVLRVEPLPPAPPMPSSRHLDDRYASSYVGNDRDVEEEAMLDHVERSSPPAELTSDEPESSSSARPSGSDSDSCPKSSSSGSERLPPPPTEYELRVMGEDGEDDDPDLTVDLSPMTNASFSSLLNHPYEVNLPTPSATRSDRFHPDQYLLAHQIMSDMSEAGSIPGSSISLDLQYPDAMRRFGNRRPTSDRTQVLPSGNSFQPDATSLPSPGVTNDRLEMSSLSEADEEDDLLYQRSQRPKRRTQGRQGTDAKSRPARRSKKAPGRSGARHKEAPQEMQPLFYGHDGTPGAMLLDPSGLGLDRANTNV